MQNERQVKVVHKDGDRIRALIGVVRQSDDIPGFIEVHRLDGSVVKINSRYVFLIAPAEWRTSPEEIHREGP